MQAPIRIKQCLGKFLLVPLVIFAGQSVFHTVAAQSEADPPGVTRYVRFTDDTGTHSGILNGQTISVLDGDPVFDDGVSPTGRTSTMINRPALLKKADG